MEPFVSFEAPVAPMDRENVDTDAILPKQYLKMITRTGFGPYCFDEWRYLDKGEPGMDCSKRRLNPDFPLNFPRYKGAGILLARKNFGCGSSREHAPWALLGYGFRVIVAPSFGDIFFNNCFKNGMLPIVLSEADVDWLFAQTLSREGYRLRVDLPSQTIFAPDGRELKFDVTEHRKRCLLEGLDEIGLTLQKADAIKRFEARRAKLYPWMFAPPPRK